MKFTLPLLLSTMLLIFMSNTELKAQCSVPTGRSESSIGNTTATLNWNTVAEATSGFRIRYRVQNGSWTYEDSGTNSLSLTGLTAGLFYEWQVRSLCDGENSSFTSTSTFQTTGGATCDTPEGLSTSGITETEATVNWGAATGAVEYRLRHRRNDGSPWTTTIVGGTSHELTSLTAGVEYQWNVRTQCAALNSAFTSNQEFTTSTTVNCTVPTNPTSTAVTKKTADIQWDAVGDATHYRIRYKKGNDPYTSVDVDGTDTTLQDVVPGNLYSYTVRAYCAEDNSINSGDTDFENFTTDDCVAPTGVSDGSVTDNTALISWDAVTEVDNYKVTYVVKGADEWLDTVTISSASTSTTLTGLHSGSNYRYEVAAVCDSDNEIETFSESPSGGRYAFSTTGATSCATPTGFTSTGNGDNQLNLSWNAGSGELNGYEIRFRMIGAPNWDTAFVATGNTTTSISSLEAGSDYQYYMRNRCAVNNSLVSPWTSKVSSSTTGTSTCTVPTTVESTPDQFFSTISWDAVGAAVQYNVRYKPTTSSTWLFTATASTSMNLTNLNQGTPYQFSVRSVCAADTSILSDHSSIEDFTTTGTSACDRPNRPDSSNVEQTTATITWNEIDGAVDYRMRYRPANSTFTYVTIGGTDTTINVTGLSAGTQYEFQVASICSLDESVKSIYSKTRLFTTDAAAKEQGQEEESSLAVEVYPNPTQGFFTINVNSDVDEVVSVEIIDQFGELIEKSRLQTGDNLNYNFSEQRRGVYTIRVITDNELETQRLVLD